MYITGKNIHSKQYVQVYYLNCIVRLRLIIANVLLCILDYVSSGIKCSTSGSWVFEYLKNYNNGV